MNRTPLVIGVLTLAVLLALHERTLAFSTHQTTLSRSVDKVEEVVGNEIRIVVNFSNMEPASMRGFFHSEHLPQGLAVTRESVAINGSAIAYAYAIGATGEVYPNCTTHRWMLETPDAFSENNPIPSGGSVQIIYRVTSNRSGTFHLCEFNWAGYLPGTSEAAFGHSMPSDCVSLTFTNGGGEPQSGSGSGCTMSPQAEFGFEWVLLFFLLLFMRKRFAARVPH
jgi:hypothetical protein